MEKVIKKKIIIIAVICLILIAAGVIFIVKKSTPIPDNSSKDMLPATNTGEPINPKDNPARAIPLDENLGYGCGGPGSFKPKLVKEPDAVWNINKDGTETLVSLGKYRIDLLERTAVDVEKIWFYFKSDKLGRESDKWYGLENSYVSGMIFDVNGYKKEINLGGDEYMFIELIDYPLGDFYPYLKEQYVEFEVSIKVKCKTIQSNKCIGNNGEPLDYVNNADIQTNFRIFALGCEDFTVDLSSSAKLKY